MEIIKRRTSERGLESDLQKLKRVLPEGMRVEYNNYDFKEERPDFATFTFICDEKLEQDLEAVIGSSLERDKTGVGAYMRFVGYHESKDGKHLYVAEVVPFKDIHKLERATVTEDFIHRLPKVIREFWMKH